MLLVVIFIVYNVTGARTQRILPVGKAYNKDEQQAAEHNMCQLL
jgi:hypothetical protein